MLLGKFGNFQGRRQSAVLESEKTAMLCPVEALGYLSALLSMLHPGNSDELGPWVLPLIPISSFTRISVCWPHLPSAKNYRVCLGKSLPSLTWRS